MISTGSNRHAGQPARWALQVRPGKLSVPAWCAPLRAPAHRDHAASTPAALVGRGLRARSGGNRFVVRGVAQQVIAADAFDRDQFPQRAMQRRRQPGRFIASCFSLPAKNCRCGPHTGQADWLGVEAAVKRILVFAPAVRKTVQSRASPVFGRSSGRAVISGVARAALGAVDEGIAMAAGCPVVQFIETVGRRRSHRAADGCRHDSMQSCEMGKRCGVFGFTGGRQ